MAALGWCQLLLVFAIAYASRAIVDWLPAWQPTNTYLSNVKTQNDLRFAFDALRTRGCAAAGDDSLGRQLPARARGGDQPDGPHPPQPEAEPRADAARIVGRVNATNTVGSLAGTLAFTLLVVPLVGSQHAQQALAAIAAVAAAAALWVVGDGRTSRRSDRGLRDRHGPRRVRRAAGAGPPHRIRPLGGFVELDQEDSCICARARRRRSP